MNKQIQQMLNHKTDSIFRLFKYHSCYSVQDIFDRLDDLDTLENIIGHNDMTVYVLNDCILMHEIFLHGMYTRIHGFLFNDNENAIIQVYTYTDNSKHNQTTQNISGNYRFLNQSYPKKI